MSRLADVYPADRVTIREVGLRDGLQLVRQFPSTAGKRGWLDREHAERLGRRIQNQAAVIAQATCEFLLMLAEFDAREGVRFYEGLKSTAHWLGWACSMAAGTAREHLRVARALPELPLTVAEFGAGRLSYSKVREITRVVGRVEEEVLVEMARAMTAAQLSRTISSFRAVDGSRLDQESRREARWHVREDGMVEIRAVLPAETGAELRVGGCAGEVAVVRVVPPGHGEHLGGLGTAGHLLQQVRERCPGRVVEVVEQFAEHDQVEAPGDGIQSRGLAGVEGQTEVRPRHPDVRPGGVGSAPQGVDPPSLALAVRVRTIGVRGPVVRWAGGGRLRRRVPMWPWAHPESPPAVEGRANPVVSVARYAAVPNNPVYPYVSSLGELNRV